MPKSTANVGMPELTRRRSHRVIIGVAIVVMSEGSPKDKAFEESTQTLVVNAHGALIGLSANVKKGQLLRLKNRATKEEQLCKIMHLGQTTAGVTQIGVEFTSPSPNFWRIAFPPDDWVMTAQAQETKSSDK
jgi:hypothetical protein